MPLHLESLGRFKHRREFGWLFVVGQNKTLYGNRIITEHLNLVVFTQVSNSSGEVNLPTAAGAGEGCYMLMVAPGALLVQTTNYVPDFCIEM